jgi:Rieske Fe-S protein
VSVDGPDGPTLVARPTASGVVAFSAVCTHMACTVAVAGREYQCPCHGSAFDAFTGAVLVGPATEPLAPVAVRVVGDQVVAT